MFSSNASQVSDSATYIEDIFSCFLYTGTGTTAGSTQTITNGIDLAGEGGMVWIKDRAVKDHFLFDTNRGPWKYLRSNTTDAQPGVNEDALSAFNSNGFTLTGDNNVTQNGQKYVSWTFRKQPKFFDVVTYTGNDVAGRTVAHNLGSEPAVIIVKSTSAAGDWAVYHRSLGATKYILLNSTAAAVTDSGYWQNTTPTSTEFTLGGAGRVNYGGRSYVAYLFAHDAGGFGESGTDNVISCGSFTTDGSGNATVTLGYEPQWVLYKPSTAVNNWKIFDNMRGMVVGNGDQALYPNTSGAEVQDDSIQPAATGFSIVGGDASATHIYIAIRRGPMKTPTTGTSVFTPIARTGTGTAVTVTGFQGPLDSLFVANRTDSTDKFLIANRLTAERYTLTSSTAAETVSVTAAFPVGVFGVMNGFNLPATTSNVTNKSATTYINYGFTRAPGFMDVRPYTGTGSATTFSHNLAAVPELMIVKCRNAAGSWWTYHVAVGNGAAVRINADSAPTVSSTFWNSTTPTDTVFSLGTHLDINGSGETNVAYLFASCPGVSKVGSYTGTATTQQINCGFTGGARFVLIKRTDSTGDWYVWDSARGIVAGNDPYLLLNSTAAEVTSTDYIDPVSSGFEISSTAPAAINASGGSFIFLAIA